MKLDSLLKLGLRETVGIGLAAACAFLFIVDWVVVRPVWRRAETLRREIRTQEEFLVRDLVVLDRRAEVSAVYEAVRASVETPAGPDEMINSMSAEVDRLANRAGLKLEATAPRESAKTDLGQEYLISVDNFEADMDSLLRFLNEVHAAPGTLRVARLTLSTGKGRGAVKGSMLISKFMVPAGA